MDQVEPFERLLPAEAYASPAGSDTRDQRELCRLAIEPALEVESSTERVAMVGKARWSLAKSILAFRVRTTTGPSLVFSEPERVLLDFGLLDGRLIETELDLPDFCREEMTRPEEMSGFEIRYTTEILCGQYQQLFLYSEEKAVQRDLSKARATLAARQHDLKRMQVRRDQAVSDEQALQPLLSVFEALDETLPLYAHTLSMIESDSGPSALNRRDHHTLSKKYTLLRDEENKLLTQLNAEESLSSTATQIVLTTMQIPKYEARVQRLEAELEQIGEERQEKGCQVAVERLTEEMETILGRVRQCGGRFSRRAEGILTRVDTLNGKLGVIRAVERVAAGDLEMTDKWRTGVWKRPRIGLLPGWGEAIYEEASDRIWVPIVLRDAPEPLIATALAHYRMAADPVLLSEFSKISTEEARRTGQKLPDRFVKAYVTWCLRDSKGFRSLPRKVHNWFIDRLYQNRNPEGD